jgi:hypothetical protein
MVGTVTFWVARDDSVEHVRSNDVMPAVSTVTVPAVPEPVDTSTCLDGWYLILAPMIVTIENELLLQAARELTIEARNVGYATAKIIRPPPSNHECDAEGVCSSATAPDGYFVILKGPYVVPEWTDSDADRDSEFNWHQTTQAREVAEAGARGLTMKPGVAWFEF